MLEYFSAPFLYIDPNAGFQIVSQSGPFVGFLLAFLAALLWPFKFLFKAFFNFFKKKPVLGWIVMILILTGLGGAVYHLMAASRTEAIPRRVIVLGMDGLDPGLTEKFMAEGKLPHFQTLKEKGAYRPLRTVVPPQSPVAWSTFATGLNPGGHGLYDFLWRHTENYMPDLALSEYKPAKTLNILGWRIPMGRSGFVNRRRGKTLWAETSEAGVPTTVIHCPVTFPVERVSAAMLAGMGVPDIRGTQGTFSYYSDKASAEKTQGGRRILVHFAGGKAQSFLSGPRGDGGREISVPLEMRIREEGGGVDLSWTGGEQTLHVGEWSPWTRVDFNIDASTKLTGMTRFYLRSVSPEFSLYASAFQFTPENPVYPISYPGDYAKRLKDAVGDFHTLGMPHDTWALNEGAMTDEMFLEQSRTILDEEIKMLRHELLGFRDGLLVFVIVTPDRIQHMFWRAIDEKHPLYTPADAHRYGHVIEQTYRDMDEILGIVMNHADDETTLMVVSDHGFKSFRRAVHLNSWLRDEGYLVYEEARSAASGGEFFEGVDWSRSRAYAVGLGSLYLNLKGREKRGIVNPGEEAEALKKEIAGKLSELKDPGTGQSAVRRVFFGNEIYSGEAAPEAPDLLAGFQDGYRASWQTALGAAPEALMEDNLKKWSGDHIIDAELVPGIFFSNRAIAEENPSLYDICPTILGLFGLPVSPDQPGSDLFQSQPELVE